MRLPNGYGSVTKLSGKRRKPYMVRITEGCTYHEEKDDYALNRYVLGYYETRKAALDALAEYNKNPYSLSGNAFTFREIYEIWKKEHYPSLCKNSIITRDSAYKYCAPIADMDIRDVRLAALQDVINNCPHGSGTKKNIKTIMHNVFEYACQNDIVGRDYTEFLKIEYSEPTYERAIFSKTDMDYLWTHSDEWDCQILLILIYSGLRVNELLRNTAANVNPDERWIYVPRELAKNKTSIRYVPIHEKVYPLVMNFYNRAISSGSETLMTNPAGYPVAYNNFATRNLKRLNTQFETKHRMHDTRHTFATVAHQCGMDRLTTQKILGHAPDTITERVYTHISIDDMKREIDKYSI